jgi:hypothetical protein
VNVGYAIDNQVLAVVDYGIYSYTYTLYTSTRTSASTCLG